MGEILLPEYKTNARLVHGVMFFFNFFSNKNWHFEEMDNSLIRNMI